MTTRTTIPFVTGTMAAKFLHLFSLSSLILLSSCLKEPEYKFEGYGDVYMQKKQVSGVNKYLTYCFVYANTGMTSATVTLPTGGQIVLSPFMDDNYTFSNNPSSGSFGNNPPAPGTYNFTVTTQDNELKSLNDVLTADEIGVPVITEAAYKLESAGIQVKWNSLTGVNAFNVKLFKQSGELVYVSTLIVPTKTDWLIDQFITGWVSGNPTPNTTYTLEVHAFKFEDGATDQNYVYNLQCESFAKTTVTWGF